MRWSIVGLLSMLLSGCHWSGGSCGLCSTTFFCGPREGFYFRGIDELSAKHSAQRAAAVELRKLSRTCGLSCDYKNGFEQAYVDVALGADGQVPPLPPREYWKDKNRTCEGHQGAQEWFAGYSSGAERAVACRAQFNVVPTSGAPGFDDGWGHSLRCQYP